MKTKKTAFVWIIIILLVIDLISTYVAVIGDGLGLYKSVGSDLFGKILKIISGIISIVYLIKLFRFRLSDDLLKWTNIAFGYGVLITLYSLFSIGITSVSTEVINSILSLILTVVVWTFFYRHLKKLAV